MPCAIVTPGTILDKSMKAAIFKTSYLIVIGLVSALLFHTPALLAQTEFSSLEERMTLQEFQQTGLDKLSNEELSALNGWIRSHSLGGEAFAEAVAEANNQSLPASVRPERMGFLDYKGEESPIQSVIVGDFEGWRGDTEFELENGMVWKQAEQGMLGVKPTANQKVLIEPGFLSAWYLKIDGVNKRLRIKRIK